jgi:hypothetical protein
MPTFDSNSILGLLNIVDMGNAADISEVHAAFIFRSEVIKLGEFLGMYGIPFRKNNSGPERGTERT